MTRSRIRVGTTGRLKGDEIRMAKKGIRKPARGKKHVYFFGKGKADGDRGMRDTLGGKGAGLAEMTNAGLPVPPGLTVSTAACNLFVERGG